MAIRSHRVYSRLGLLSPPGILYARPWQLLNIIAVFHILASVRAVLREVDYSHCISVPCSLSVYYLVECKFCSLQITVQ